MRSLWNRLLIEWCRTFHSQSSWPTHGHYHCRACFRVYPVPWQEGENFLRRTISGTNLSGQQARFVVFEFQEDRG
jgi:hypothetical protein